MGMTATLRLNLGAGATVIPGFTPIDRKVGSEVFPLTGVADDSVDEIRASHVLEHAGYADGLRWLEEWVRVLKPGALIKLAVPDARWISRELEASSAWDERTALLEAYLMGGHVDADDVHHSAWTEPKLRAVMEAAGLISIERWTDDVQDCAALPVSLNLCGRKPEAQAKPQGIKVCAIISMPRLCFSDMMFCALDGLMPLRIPVRRYTGAFWGQGVTNMVEQVIADGFDLILTLDYDTMFTERDVAHLIRLMFEHPEIDAIQPVQLKRGPSPAPLFTMRDPAGALMTHISTDVFRKELLQVASGHFGLTLFRAARFADLPRPWFLAKPGPDGRWQEGRTDEDLAFWERWRTSGRTLYQANRVRIGHLERVIQWPAGDDFHCALQRVEDWDANGAPSEVKRCCYDS